MSVLSTVLGGNTSSRLWNEIREKRGLVYYIRSSADDYSDAGHVAVQAGCSLDRLKEAIKIVKVETLKLTEAEVEDSEIKLAKDYLTGRLALSLEDSHAVSDMIAEDVLFEGKTRGVKEVLEGIDKVAKTDVLRLAKQLFGEGKEMLTVLGKLNKNDVY